MNPMELSVSYHAGTKITYLTPLVTQITCNGDVTEAGRHCTVTLRNTLNGDSKAVSIELGREIRCMKNGKEFFRGFIFTTDSKTGGDFTITAHDANYYLTKSSDSKVFRKQAASTIILSLCKQYGIPFGKVDDTGYVIPKLILRNKSLYDMITIALTETRKKTGKVFLLGNENGKLTLRQRKNQFVQLVISGGTNLIDATYSESIEDLRNSVRLTGSSGEDAAGISVSDAASIAKYGMMREKQHEGDKTNAQLKPIANELLKELNKVDKTISVSAIGDTSIKAGKSVRVYEKMTGITGGFYVIADAHTYEVNGKHTMSLNVSRTLDVAELEYEAPDETPPSTSTNNSGGSSNGEVGGGNSASSIARSFVGKLKYRFGGTDIAGGSGDCSAFVQYVMRRVGVNLGRDTSSQVKAGRQIKKSEARAGDLVFFQGTYRSGVSHVGIVTSGGKCISLASSGCKEHSYRSGYWGGHFMQIRRV